MIKLPLCVVTMAYNEIDFLPLWFKYYSSQVGAQNCYVIDHGNDDGPQLVSGCSAVLTIPGAEHNDEEQRCRLVSKFCTSLLNLYERAIYVDCDEIIAGDHLKYSKLIEFCLIKSVCQKCITTATIRVPPRRRHALSFIAIRNRLSYVHARSPLPTKDCR